MQCNYCTNLVSIFGFNGGWIRPNLKNAIT